MIYSLAPNVGAPDDDCAVQLKDDLCNLLSKGGFPLTKWASNSQKVMEATPLQERVPTLMSTADPEKMSDSLRALGTSWNTQDDLLTFTNVSSILTEADPKTKRSLISLYSRIFDPMGLLTPFLMVPKSHFKKFGREVLTGISHWTLTSPKHGKRGSRNWPT